MDGFKVINDNKGHEIGDILLRSISVRLSASMRASDTAARFGGDEFVLMLMDVKCEVEIGKVADRILRNIAKPIVIDQQEVKIGASLGISFFLGDGKTVSALIKAADKAMYTAKQQGRGYAFYHELIGDRKNPV